MKRRDLLLWIPAYGLAGFLAYLVGTSDDGSLTAETPTGGQTLGSSSGPGDRTPGEGDIDSVPVDPGAAETFADAEAWDALDGSVAGTEACGGGSDATCLRLERGPQRSRIARRFEEPLDLTGVRPSVSMRAAENTYPRLQLFDASGDELRLRAPVRGGLDHQPINFGVDRVVGEPDLSTITEIRFVQGGSPTVWLERLAFHEPLPPTVLLAFDDGYVSEHPAQSILREHGYPATVFVRTSSVGGEDNISHGALRSLKRDGWDVSNHTADQADLLSLDAEGQRQQIVGGRRWLIRNDFEPGADYFTYPYNNYDQTSIDAVEEYHRLAFAGGFPAAGAVPNRLLVPRTAVSEVEGARRAIDLTARYGGVTCLFFPVLDDPGERVLRGTVEHLASRETAGDVDVATASDLDELLGS